MRLLCVEKGRKGYALNEDGVVLQDF